MCEKLNKIVVMKNITPEKTNTTITIKKSTHDLLSSLGTKEESYDDIINRLLSDNKILKIKLKRMETIYAREIQESQ